MVPGLVSLFALRDHLEQAIAALEPVLPALEAWEQAQQDVQERAPEPARPEVAPEVAPDRPVAPGEPQKPALGLFDPLPPRRPANGASSPASDHCVVCGTEITQAARGARRRYCSDSCKTAAAAARARARGRDAEGEAEIDPAPLPAQVPRPFQMVGYPDDPRSDPALLQPPRLVWE